MPTTDDKFVIRLPEGMRDTIKRNAEVNRRTMNAEIVHYIDLGLAKEIAATGAKFDGLDPAAAGESNP